jgi:hypothetical protein
MAEASIDQMAMAHDATPGGFLDRLQYNLAVVARVKLETPTTPAAEWDLAKRVLADPAALAATMAVLIVSGPNLIGKWSGTACTATDAEIFSQASTYWPLWA